MKEVTQKKVFPWRVSADTGMALGRQGERLRGRGGGKEVGERRRRQEERVIGTARNGGMEAT